LRLKALAILVCITVLCSITCGFFKIDEKESSRQPNRDYKKQTKASNIMPQPLQNKGQKPSNVNSNKDLAKQEEPARGGRQDPAIIKQRVAKEKLPKSHKEKTVTVSDIEERYSPRFLALKDEFNGELNSLIVQGLEEYGTYQQNNIDPPLIKLVLKYLSLGRALEDECDRRFNNLVGQMKQELSANSLPVNLIKKAERQYENQKLQEKRQLIKNGMKYIGYH